MKRPGPIARWRERRCVRGKHRLGSWMGALGDYWEDWPPTWMIGHSFPLECRYCGTRFIWTRTWDPSSGRDIEQLQKAQWERES